MSRILYVAGLDPSLPLGHAVHVRRLAGALAARGHEVRLLTHEPSATVACAGVQTSCVRTLPVARLRHLSAEIRMAGAIARGLRQAPADVLLVRQELLSFAPLLLRRTAGASRPPLVIENNASAPGLASLGGASAARVRLARTLEGRLLRAADATGAVSAGLAELQIRAHGLDPRSVFVVPNGAWLPSPCGEADRCALRAFYAMPPDAFVAAFIGSLNHGQGLETVLRAMARRPEGVFLWVVGDGPLSAEYRARAASLGLEDRVRFLGGRAEEDAARLASAAQALLAPYPGAHPHASCGDPLKLLFGLACNRPLLGSRLPALARIESLEAGELVAADDDAAWADALARWAARWRTAGRPLSRWPWPEGEGPGPRYVRRGRTWDHTAAAWEEVFAFASSQAARTRVSG